MDQPNTTAWCIAVCTATGNFFTYWTPCSCGWKTPCFSCNTDHLNIAISYIFPDTGLARLPQCQSGIWIGVGKISSKGCGWYSSSVAMSHFIGGRSGGTIYYKPVQCPANYIMTGTRMYGIGDGVDEEHVDAYCCPFS